MAKLALLAVVAAMFACGNSDPTKDCPADAPASCPTSGAPSYATDVAPLIQQYCVNRCHGPGGVEAGMPLVSYANIQHVGPQNIDAQIYDCLMPMSPPDPTIAERVTLLTWIVCGAPDN
jgi:hypothetical protein